MVPELIDAMIINFNYYFKIKIVWKASREIGINIAFRMLSGDLNNPSQTMTLLCKRLFLF